VKDKKKLIDDLFREKLGAYSEVPPADAWTDLDKKLDTLVPHVPSSPFRWLGHIGMVSVIAVLSVSLIHKFSGESKNESNIVKEQTVNKLETTNSNNTVDNSIAGASEVQVPGVDANTDNSDLNTGNSVAGEAADVNTASQVASNNNSVNTTGNGGHSSKNPTTVSKYRQDHVASVGGAHKVAGANGVIENVVPGNASENIYNSSSNNNSAEINTKGDNKNDNGNQEVKTNSKIKSEAPKKVTPPLVSNKSIQAPAEKKIAPKERKPIDFARWEAGVKGGYERGFDNIAARKFVIAPYLQYNLSKKVAVMIQPAAKYAQSAERIIGTPQSYYNVKNDGQVVNAGNYSTILAEGSSIDTYYHSRLRYTQTHDSIVKANKAGGSYTEFELPVLIKYNISNKVSVYGGANMIYSQMTGVKEQTYTKAGIMKTVDTVVSAKSVQPASPAVSDIITYNGSPISDYNGPLYPSSQINRVRFGAMLGVSYQYSGRWLLDALVQQNPSPKDIRGGYNINAPLSSTYIRLSVGYKLTK